MTVYFKNKKRRGTTLSSNSRVPLKTYYRSKTELNQTSPFKKKPLKRRTRRVLLGLLNIIFIGFLIVGLLYSLLISSKPKLILNSAAYHNAAAYQQHADKLLASIKNRNKLTFDPSSIAADMKRKFPEIAAVDTELPVFSQKVTLRLKIAPPSLKLSSAGRSYVVDAQGVVVQEAKNMDLKNLPKVEDNSGYRIQLGKPVLDAEAVRFIKALDVQCRQAGVMVDGYTLPPAAQQIDLRSKDHSYFVKFYLGGDALTQAGQYLAARRHFTESRSSPSEYLDVRVAGKVFYK